MQTVEGPGRGIVQPLKMQTGGSRLQDYYEKNLPIIQDTVTPAHRRAKTLSGSSFCLPLRPPALRSSGTWILLKLVRTLPLRADGRSVKERSRKEKLAQRDAALKMAISDQAAARDGCGGEKLQGFARDQPL